MRLGSARVAAMVRGGRLGVARGFGVSDGRVWRRLRLGTGVPGLVRLVSCMAVMPAMPAMPATRGLRVRPGRAARERRRRAGGRFVAASAPVRQLLQDRYVVVKVNFSPQNRNEALLSRWPKARGYPHFYVLDPEGNVIASQASAELEAGNDYDEAKVLAFLRRHLPARPAAAPGP